jgi:hypothetical protein
MNCSINYGVQFDCLIMSTPRIVRYFFKWGCEQQQNVLLQWIKWHNQIGMTQNAKFRKLLSIALHVFPFSI